MALGRRRLAKGAIRHSDQGSQYTSKLYQQQLQDAGLTASMSRKGMPYDNAVMESFFASLKHELTHHQSFPDRDSGRTQIFQYIEILYKNVVRVSVEGFTDFTRAFDYANSVTIMGANVEKSLVATRAMKRGFTLDVVKEQQPRAGLPYILPLIRDGEGAYVSKRMLLTMPDGSVSKEWNSECFGQKAVDRALQFIGDRKAIFASHDWCKPDMPENVERIPYCHC